MANTSRRLLPCFLLLPLFGAGTIKTPHSQPRPARAQETIEVPAIVERARSADSFVNSIGINLHADHNAPDNFYRRWGTLGGDNDHFADGTTIFDKLRELGIRHVRDTISVRHRLLARRLGIQLTAVDATPDTVVNRIRSVEPAVEAVEGPDDTDVAQRNRKTGKLETWFRYGDKTNASPTNEQPLKLDATRQVMRDLYREIRRHPDPKIARLSVLAPIFAVPENAARVAPIAAFDFETAHPILGTNLPSAEWDTRWLPQAHRIGGPNSPARLVMAAATGYATSRSATTASFDAVSESAQAKYLPRLFAEAFNRHVVRTFAGELGDEYDKPNDPAANFGLVHYDGTPKPAYAALKNLISLLSESKAAPFDPQSFGFTITGGGPNLHHLLLQKSDGDFYLLLWQEIGSFDAKLKQDVTPPGVETAVTFAQSVVVVRVYQPGRNLEPETTVWSRREPGRTVTLTVPDAVVVVQVTPQRRERPPTLRDKNN